MLRRAFRPRVLFYTAVVWTLIVGMAVAIAARDDLRVDVLRDRGVNYRLAEDGLIENVYRLNLMNASEYPLQVRINLKSDSQDMRVVEQESLTVSSTESRWVVVHVQANPEVVRGGSNPIEFQIESTRLKEGEALPSSREIIEESAVFLAPR